MHVQSTYISQDQPYFSHRYGDWEPFDNPCTAICRQMTFISNTEDSIIREFDLRQLKNGKVKIVITFFSNTYSEAKEYFSQLGVILTTQSPSSWGVDYQAKNLQEAKRIFTIINENNKYPKFPDSHRDKIKDILANAREY